MGEDVETLKRRMPLMEYLRQHNWTGSSCESIRVRRTLSVARGDPALVLCQHAQGCFLLPRLRPGRRSDSLRPVIPPICLSARASPALIHRPLQKPTLPRCLSRLLLSISSNSITTPRHSAISTRRGLQDPALIRELEIGYAPGGSLRRHLTAQGYSFDLLRQTRPAQRAAAPMLSISASSSRCARANTSSTSTAAASALPSPIAFCPAPRAACMHGRRFGTAPR